MQKLLLVLSLAFVLYLALFVITPIPQPMGNRSIIGYAIDNNLIPMPQKPTTQAAQGITDTQSDFQGDSAPPDALAQLNQDTVQGAVLGTTTTDDSKKWIDVNLETQTLTAWDGDQKFAEFKISSGIADSTPRGTYYIWYKTRRQVMSGGSKALGTYYYLPDVPYNMFFKGSYAIHGAYWHSNWGHQMSHGCVNAPIDMSGVLFDWTGPKVDPDKNWARATKENPGTKVVLH